MSPTPKESPNEFVALEVAKPFPFTVDTCSLNSIVGLIGQGPSSLEIPGRFNDSLETDLPGSVVSFFCQISIFKGPMWKSRINYVVETTTIYTMSGARLTWKSQSAKMRGAD